VNDEFIKAWRFYQKRWKAIIARLELEDLINYPWPNDANLPVVPRTRPVPIIDETAAFKSLWESADDDAAEIVRSFGTAMSHAVMDVDNADYEEEYSEGIKQAAEVFEGLQAQIGLDLRGVLRRRRLVPMILIPKPVAARHGNKLGPLKSGISLFLQLQQAQEAFIFGVPLAAVSLMRALTELVLTHHYGFSEKDIIQKINQLGKEKAKNRLHNLRMLANDVLHYGDKTPDKRDESEFARAQRLQNEKDRQARRDALATYAASLTDSDRRGTEDATIQTERELAFYLRALRDLIENAPIDRRMRP
jgi:hypothetical protein